MEAEREAGPGRDGSVATVSVDDRSGTVLVVTSGEMTRNLVDDLVGSLGDRTEASRPSPRLLIDGSALRSVSTEAAHALVNLQRHVLRQGGFFSMLNLGSEVRRSLELVGLLPFLELPSSDFERELRRPKAADRDCLRRWFR